MVEVKIQGYASRTLLVFDPVENLENGTRCVPYHCIYKVVLTPLTYIHVGNAGSGCRDLYFLKIFVVLIYQPLQKISLKKRVCK